MLAAFWAGGFVVRASSRDPPQGLVWRR